jgi:hypothetical protein
VTVDARPPDTVITAGPSGLIADTTPTFEFTNDEPDGRFECRVDGAPFAACDSPHTTAALADGSHTIAVRAIDRAGNVDPIPATRTVVVDTTGPDTTIVAGPAGPTLDSTPEFQFTADEPGATFECRVDDAPFAACTSPYVPDDALADGDHTFQVRAIDGAGNADASPASRSFTVDTTAPSVTLTSGPEGPTGDATPTFAFTAEPGATFQCRVDNGAFAACTSPHTVTAQADGDHTFAVRAVDAVGNVGPATERQFTVDTVVPDTTIDTGPSGVTGDATPTFTFHSSDPTALFECSIDGGAFSTCEAPFTTPELSDGEHTIAVRAVDPAGNADGTPDERTITVDTTAPDTEITDGPDDPTDDPTPAFTFTDGSSDSFECRVDDGPWVLCQSPYVTPSLANGEHTFAVRAFDAAGNVDPTPATRTFTVDVPPPDADAPVTAIAVAPPAVTADPAPQFAFSANEPGSTFECSLDGGAFAPCTSPFTAPALSDGQHTFEVRATDGAGNVDATPAAYSFLVDTQSPTTQIIAAPPALTGNATPTFAFAAGEPGTTFECSLDGAAFTACQSPVTLDALADGDHTFAVRAVDAAGNADPSPVTRTFTIDTTAPATSIGDGPTGVTADATPTFTFDAGPGARLECRIDDAAFAPCTSPFTTDPLPDGDHVFAVRGVDAAGNADPTPATRGFTVDTEAPQTAVDQGPPDVASGTTATFAFSASEPGASFECRVDSFAFVPCSSPFTTDPLPDGTHTFEVRARDAVGNADGSPARWSFTLDNTAPESTITAGPPVVGSDPTPRFEFGADEPGVTFSCRIDGGAYAPCTSPFVGPALEDGTHTFEVIATDAAGNTEATPATRTFKVDALAPQTAISAGPPSRTRDTTPTFEFTAGEPGTLFECRLGDAPFAPCESPFTTAPLADGTYTFDVAAIDEADNRDASPAARTFTVDTQAPQTTIDGPSGPTNDPEPTFTMTSNEPGVTFQCQVDDGPFTACTTPFTTGTLPEGEHVITIRAVDAAGNEDPTPPARTIVVDTTAPDATISSGPSGTISDTTPTFSFATADAGARLECRVDSEPFAPCTSPLTVGPLADGDHTFAVRAVDAAGNVDPEPAVRAFTIESRAPQTTITSGPSGVTADPTPAFAFAADEPGVHYECRFVDQPFQACPTPYTAATLADGRYALEVRAIDAAGNVDATPASRTFTVRRATPPPPNTPTPPSARPACADGTDNDGDGVADQLDPGCLSGSGGAYDPVDRDEADALAELPDAQLGLRCGRARIRLFTVRQVGRRVLVSGAARLRFVGQRVTIRLIPGERAVGTTTVRPGGGFRTKVPAPRRVTRRTFYRASIGSVRSGKLKLRRRTIISQARVRKGRVVIAGRLVKPLPAGRQTIVLKRRMTCRRWVVVARTKAKTSGRFRFAIRRPSGARAAIYRAHGKVKAFGRTARTRSLPLPVRLRR